MMVDERGLSDPTTSESKHQHQACKLEPQHQPFKPTEPQHHTFEALEPQHLKLFGDPRDPSLYLNETLRLRGYGFRCQRQLALTSGRVECFADQECALESLDSVMANRTEHCLYNNRMCQLVRAGDAEALRQALQAGECPNAHNKQGETVRSEYCALLDVAPCTAPPLLRLLPSTAASAFVILLNNVLMTNPTQPNPALPASAAAHGCLPQETKREIYKRSRLC